MQEGSLRADVNVSVRPKGSTELGTRCEIKNMNSMRFIMQAIEFEARRQIAILEDGGTVEQETRLYDPNRGETRSMRSKEEAHDYRYFPDPDLLPLELEQAWVDGIAAGAAGAAGRQEGALRARLRHDRIRRRGLDRRDRERQLLRGGGAGRDGKQAANWVINELFGRLNKEGRGIEASPVAPGAARRADRPGRLGRDLGQDRQGRLRDPLDRGRRSGDNRRRARGCAR